MVLTSYNFNQNLKDNILSMYTSTTFDKNFKTFYKGDPYNFDIDMNFHNKNKKGDKKLIENMNINNINYNNIDEEKFKKSGMINTKKMNQTNAMEKLHKKKAGSLHDKIKPTANIIYEENYQANTKIVPLKFPANKVNTHSLRNIYAKDFHLPSINSKNFSVLKIGK